MPSPLKQIESTSRVDSLPHCLIRSWVVLAQTHRPYPLGRLLDLVCIGMHCYPHSPFSHSPTMHLEQSKHIPLRVDRVRPLLPLLIIWIQFVLNPIFLLAHDMANVGYDHPRRGLTSAAENSPLLHTPVLRSRVRLHFKSPQVSLDRFDLRSYLYILLPEVRPRR